MSGESLQKTEFPVWNGYAPLQGGPKAVPISLDFGTLSSIDFDLIDSVQRGVIDFVQSVWVDNSDNTDELTLLFGQTAQRLVVPALAQGLWPVIAPSGLRCTASTIAVASLKVQLIFLNVPMPMTQFGPVSVTANVTASATPITGPYTDASGNTTADVSTTLFAANAAAKRRIVQNPPINPESIWINFGGVAAVKSSPSWEIVPGDKFDTGTGPIDRTEWTIIADNAIAYTAKEA